MQEGTGDDQHCSVPLKGERLADPSSRPPFTHDPVQRESGDHTSPGGHLGKPCGWRRYHTRHTPHGHWAPFTRGVLEEEIRRIWCAGRISAQSVNRLRAQSPGPDTPIWPMCQVTHVSAPRKSIFCPVINTVIKGVSGSRSVGMRGGPLMWAWSPPDFINIGHGHSAPSGYRVCQHHEHLWLESEKREARSDYGLGYAASNSSPS